MNRKSFTGPQNWVFKVDQALPNRKQTLRTRWKKKYGGRHLCKKMKDGRWFRVGEAVRRR